jgi:hypothetical protein
MSDNLWLHLFTSNIRDLYTRDALDLLAAPEGYIYRFRYQKEHVETRTEALWRDHGLQGRPVAVHFSFQHPANFHAAAYFPLRTGIIRRAEVSGNTYIVDFELGTYLTLEDDPAEKRSDRRASAVRQFTENLHKLLGEAYPDQTENDGSLSDKRRSATLGASPMEIIKDQGSNGERFESIVRFMAPMISDRRPLFFRISGMARNDNQQSQSLTNGEWELKAGVGYTLEISHYQLEPPPEGTYLSLRLPESLPPLGDTELPLRSRYEVFSIRLFPPARDAEAQGEIRISTVDTRFGPTVHLPVRVLPQVTQQLVVPGIAAAGVFLVGLPALLGAGLAPGLKVSVTAVGSLLVFGGLWLRRSKGFGST